MGMALQDILERKEILLKPNDMTNKEKAKEIAENSKQYFYHDEYECGLACALRMAKWKDEQFEKIWHTKDEEPQFKEAKDFVNQESRVIVCVEGLAFSTHIVIDIYDWNLQYRNNIRLWAYIEDVLPKKFIQ